MSHVSLVLKPYGGVGGGRPRVGLLMTTDVLLVLVLEPMCGMENLCTLELLEAWRHAMGRRRCGGWGWRSACMCPNCNIWFVFGYRGDEGVVGSVCGVSFGDVHVFKEFVV